VRRTPPSRPPAAAPRAAAIMASPLPDSRVSGMFRQVVKFYETKQYKKGRKVADQVRRDAYGCSVIVAPVRMPAGMPAAAGK